MYFSTRWSAWVGVRGGTAQACVGLGLGFGLGLGQRVPSTGRVAASGGDWYDELSGLAALNGNGLLSDGGALHLGELAHPRGHALEETLCTRKRCWVLGPSSASRAHAHYACTTRLQLRIGGVVGGLELLLRHRVLAIALR